MKKFQVQLNINRNNLQVISGTLGEDDASSWAGLFSSDSYVLNFSHSSRQLRFLGLPSASAAVCLHISKLEHYHNFSLLLYLSLIVFFQPWKKKQPHFSCGYCLFWWTWKWGFTLLKVVKSPWFNTNVKGKSIVTRGSTWANSDLVMVENTRSKLL